MKLLLLFTIGVCWIWLAIDAKIAANEMKRREARKRYPKRWYHVEEVQNN
jgi:hypothetical protein